ncbi:hypothetical protein IMZ48_34645 [Candidatus Bathyarchaeota archaeon]|nr:hypothetical protein [Candidatus Bathyarchaeota archaeon]
MVSRGYTLTCETCKAHIQGHGELHILSGRQVSQETGGLFRFSTLLTASMVAMAV